MKVQETVYLKKPALVLYPETLHEKGMLKRCLGSESPLRAIGILREFSESADLSDHAILWDDSQNRSECLPEQDGPVQATVVTGRITRKKTDLGAFMNGLRRYINVIIDLRLNEGRDFGSLYQYQDMIHEASQDLQEILKPLFEEEAH